MDNERRGNGIFIGIVSIATLIVAIIGASFAYFSAQASSANAAVDLTAYEFNASLSMQEVYPTDAKLIPVAPDGIIENATAPDNTNLAYALNVAKKCTDDQNFRICALYEVTITNGGSTQIVLDGSITTTANNAADRTGATAFQNLEYRPVTKTGNAYTIGNSTTAVPLATVVGESIDTDTVTVPANDSVVTYVLIYLNENDNQSNEMGATFEGQIVYTSTEAENTNRLTGTFTVSGNNGG